jgi:hypothetical protein
VLLPALPTPSVIRDFAKNHKLAYMYARLKAKIHKVGLFTFAPAHGSDGAVGN